MPDSPQIQTYYREDPATGEVFERTVVTPRDKVEAKYAGYHPKPAGGAAKPVPAPPPSGSTKS